jgi:hypothetical protein
VGDRRGRDRERGATFNQQGQQVNGPQYNADRINISGSVSPEAIAEGIRRHDDGPPPMGMSTSDALRRREEDDLKLYL